ncbi:MAG: glycosyltransferase family 1 protein [Pseudomonadota bacterium]
MNIAIDARALMNPPAGVANFLIAAVNRMASMSPSYQLLLLVNRDIHEECRTRLTEKGNIRIVKSPFFVFPKIGILWFVVKLFFLLKRLKPDFYWAPSGILPPLLPRGMKTIVTVHDVVSKKHHNTMFVIDRYYYRMFFKKSVCTADILWTVSHYTKNQIKALYPARKCRDVIVGQCFEKKRFHQINITPETRQHIQRRYGPGENMILFVGTIEPRKNVRFLLSLMPELVKHGFTLLIAGAEGWGESGLGGLLQSEKIPVDKIIFSGFVTTPELISLYNYASMLVFPSLNEGFGFPALEAMLCGCPVVAADHSGLREVVKDGGKLIRGWEKKKWINGILEVHQNRAAYIRAGFSRAFQYDPAEIMKRLSQRIELEKTKISA